MAQADALTEVVRQLAAVAEQLARQPNNGNGTQTDLFKKIAQSKPPVYKGQHDPTILEDWIREFEKLFEAVGCPEESKVSSAAYYFQGEADTWWSEKSKEVTSIPNFTWDKFVDLVRDKFYPPHLQKEMAEEFAKLRMGTMSVNEYYANS